MFAEGCRIFLDKHDPIPNSSSQCLIMKLLLPEGGKKLIRYPSTWNDVL
jgi:hypothetical protein